MTHRAGEDHSPAHGPERTTTMSETRFQPVQATLRARIAAMPLERLHAAAVRHDRDAIDSHAKGDTGSGEAAERWRDYYLDEIHHRLGPDGHLPE